MDIKRCINGHFFDIDTYSLCPHCGANVSSDEVKGNKQNTKKSWLSKLSLGKSSDNKKSDVSTISANSDSRGQNNISMYTDDLTETSQYYNHNDVDNVRPGMGRQGGFQQAGSRNEKNYVQTQSSNMQYSPHREFGPSQMENVPERAGVTLDYWSKTDMVFQDRMENNKDVRDNGVNFNNPVQNSIHQGINNNGSGDLNSDYFSETGRSLDHPVTSARSAVEKASAAEEGKTLSFFSLNRQSNKAISSDNVNTYNENQTSQLSNNGVNELVGEITDKNTGVEMSGQMTEEATEPPVGWLVCIKGPHFGQTFQIHSGRNSIGRKTSNHIIIAKDGHISRERHCWINYEPRKRIFSIQPGDGSGLTYLNDDNIMSPQNLVRGDVIEIGESTFKFFPLCGDDFSWDDYIGK